MGSKLKMAAGTLFTYPDNFKAFKGLIAAEYSGAKVKVVSTPPAFVLGETNASEDFLRKFPLGKIPAFESEDGKCLNCPNAIAIFLANDALRGRTCWPRLKSSSGFLSLTTRSFLPPALGSSPASGSWALTSRPTKEPKRISNKF